MGQRLEFTASTRSAEISTAVTSCAIASKTAFDNPTYPMPTTAIFILWLAFINEIFCPIPLS